MGEGGVAFEDGMEPADEPVVELGGACLVDYFMECFAQELAALGGSAEFCIVAAYRCAGGVPGYFFFGMGVCCFGQVAFVVVFIIIGYSEGADGRS